MLYAIIDGACHPNPNGICTCAFIIKDDKSKEVYRFSKTLGRGLGFTNNIGEYSALEYTLQWFLNRPEKEITIASDSKLVINQLLGAWKVTGGSYVPVYRKILDLQKAFAIKGKTVIYRWVPRKYLDEVDRLAYEESRRKV